MSAENVSESKMEESFQCTLFDAGTEVKIISLDLIDEGERRRNDYGPLGELVASIKQYGIIQPIAVCKCFDDQAKPYKLLAGGRRFRASSSAGLTEVPVRIYPRELTELELRCVELEENVARKDLTWIEQLSLQREIHNTRLALYGPKISTSPDAEGWSKRDTARLLNKSPSSVSSDLNLANALDAFPQVDWASIQNKSEAVKVVKKLEEGLVRAELAKRAVAKAMKTDASLAANPSESAASIFRRKLIDSYMVCDCLTGMSKLESETFDLVEIDPPYAIELHDQKRLNDCEGYHEVAADAYGELMTKVLNEAYRLAKPGAWLVLWFGPEPWFEPLFQIMTAAGWKSRRLPGIWTKKTGQSMQPNYNLANGYEMFFYARKDDGVLSLPGRLNIFDFPPVPAPKKYHPTQRPMDLMREIIRTFSFENAQVLVPFAGSGTTILASALEKRQAFGYDLNPQYHESYVLEVSGLF